MRRVALTLVLLALGGAAATAAIAPTISQKEIGGARLGMTKPQVRGVLGRPTFIGQLEGGLTRFTYARADLEVYFRAGKVTQVVTWNARFRTARAVGPCSTEAELKAAYSGLRRTALGGGEVAYRHRLLVFDVQGGRVLGVGLGRGSATAFTVANSLGCGDPGA
jgi:hypothetical protein